MDIKKRPSYLNKIVDPRLMKASAIIVNTDIDRDLDIYDNDFTFYERNEEEKEQVF